MKKIFFFIVGWWLGIMPAAAQTAPFFKVLDPHPDNPYQYDKADNVIATDSCYFLVDGFVNAAGKRNQKILKTTLEGIVLDTITLTGLFDDLAIADGGGHYITHDGYILFTGEWFNPETGKMGAFLIKMDADLNVIWSQYYSNPVGDGNYYGASVVETDDGQNYLLYASTQRTYLLKTDTSGTLLWSKVIPDEVPGSINGNMIKTHDGHVLITTYVYDYNNPGSADYTASMAKVDYDGNLIWRKDVDSYTSAGEQQEPMATLLHNGGFAVMWANDSIPWIPYVTQAYFPSLYIMDSNGVKQHELRFNRYGIRSVFGLTTASNGDIIGAGFNVEALPEREKGWLFRATPEGNILWERSFSDSLQRPWSPIFFYDVSETSDGNIICGGQIEDVIPGVDINAERNVNMVILVTDAEGCLLPGCSGGLQYITAAPEVRVPRPPKWLEVAPNPAGEVLRVRVPEVENSSVVEMYDLWGRVVLRRDIGLAQGWIEMDSARLPAGCYSVAWLVGGQVRAWNKVIVQH